jgi:hypothetical protein
MWPLTTPGATTISRASITRSADALGAHAADRQGAIPDDATSESRVRTMAALSIVRRWSDITLLHVRPAQQPPPTVPCPPCGALQG